MKKIIMVLFLSITVLTATHAKADELSIENRNDWMTSFACFVHLNNFGGIDGKDNSVLFFSKLTTDDCTGNIKNIDISGVGLGIKFADQSVLMLTCTSDEPVGTYYGVSASASIIAGPKLAIFVGLNGMCTMVGGEIAIGASINGAVLTIK